MQVEASASVAPLFKPDVTFIYQLKLNHRSLHYSRMQIMFMN